MSPGQGNSSFSHDVGKHPFPGCIFLTSSQGVTVLAGGRGGGGERPAKPPISEPTAMGRCMTS